MSEPQGPSAPTFPSFPGNGWKIATIVLTVLLVASISFSFLSSGITGMAIGTDTAGQKAISYIQNNFGVSAELVKVEEVSGLYKLQMTIDNKPYLLFMTKDGTMMFPQVFELAAKTPETPATPTTSVPKSDKPTVELFVMSECPYGLQAEKGMLPVANLLKDKIDFKIRYVYYAMHGEKEVYEQMRQYCIQSEQSAKFLDYLNCYVTTGNYSSCIVQANIDKTKLSTCFSDIGVKYGLIASLADKSTWISGQFPPFNVDKDLNTAYGIQGSPTLIINGVQSSSSRDSQSLLNAVCNAFNTKPSECSQTLSSTAPSAGFGAGTGTSGGSCS